MSSINGLVTLDVHEHPNLKSVLQKSADFFSGLELHVTYFVPAGLIRKDPALGEVVRGIGEGGHSIGCHGLNHTRDEDFPSIEPKTERAILTEATKILEDTMGLAINAFRAPVFRLSKHTLGFLAELGYKADLSVTPQRLPFLSSTPWSYGGFLAPRSPYRPHHSSPYRRGNLPIIEIPISCLALPLAHGAMTVLRSSGLPIMTRMLMSEARAFNRVVVLSVHPESIAGEDWYFEKRPWRVSDLLPRVWGGMQLRYHFADVSPEKSRELSTGMVTFAKSNPELKLQSVDEYLGVVRAMASQSYLIPDTIAITDLAEDSSPA